jgi:hypothetical protein
MIMQYIVQKIVMFERKSMVFQKPGLSDQQQLSQGHKTVKLMA